MKAYLYLILLFLFSCSQQRIDEKLQQQIIGLWTNTEPMSKLIHMCDYDSTYYKENLLKSHLTLDLNKSNEYRITEGLSEYYGKYQIRNDSLILLHEDVKPLSYKIDYIDEKHMVFSIKRTFWIPQDTTECHVKIRLKKIAL